MWGLNHILYSIVEIYGMYQKHWFGYKDIQYSIRGPIGELWIKHQITCELLVDHSEV